jgi:hypothetical protein
MAEVREIFVEQPGEDVIATLEKALDMARNGELSSVGVAYVFRNGRGGQAWSSIPNVSLMIGSAARLLHHMNRVADPTDPVTPLKEGA